MEIRDSELVGFNKEDLLFIYLSLWASPQSLQSQPPVHSSVTGLSHEGDLT